MIRVTVTRDGEPFLDITLPKDDLIVGRGAEADVQLTSEAVSRRHARLTRTDAGWQVADLGAANGVYVSASDKAEPERVVIKLLAPGDRIHIETFVVELQGLPRAEAPSEEQLESLPPRVRHDETSLETNRTQFISMVDVLAARQGTGELPSVTGPILRYVSKEDGPVLEHEKPAPAAAPDAPTVVPTVTPPPTVTPASAPNAWIARMTSPSGHERNFTLTAEKVTVGAAESCEVRLPSGPGVIVELERAGDEVAFRRVPLWPFPRVIVGGRAEKRGTLAHGESFFVGEYEVTLQLKRPDR